MSGAQAKSALSHSSLKAKQRAIRDGFPESLALRVHRAISWLGRAEAETGDPDVQFMLLWVGFNAAYAGDASTEAVSERGAFNAYFQLLVELDSVHRIYDAVWERFPHEIRVLLNNKYVYAPFWHYHNGIAGYENWAQRMSDSQKLTAAALSQRNTALILSIVFDRLYVLRNQLLHGGATWNSSVNRGQVQDGAAVMSWLLPIFVDIMMDHPHSDWGRPLYPVTE